MTASRRQVAWLLLPWLCGFGALTFVPLLASLGLSFTRVGSDLSPQRTEWTGLMHYRRALGVDRDHQPTRRDPALWRLLGGKPRDPRVYTALYNSLFYSFFAVPLGLVTSLAVALLLNRRLRGMSVFRAMIYLPHALGGVATVVIWSWLFNPQFGWINRLIGLVYVLIDPAVRLFAEDGTAGWPLPGWLYSEVGCKPAVIIIHAWTMGGSMLIFLAALRRVPAPVLEAAQLDGAGSWRRLWHVTFPQITPAVLFNAAFSFVFAMQAFNEAYLLQSRGQADGLLFYVLYLYQVAFESPHQLGYASALAWILFGVLFVLMFLFLWTSRRWVHYAAT